AGAAFLARFLVDFFFIAIMGLLSLWSCVTANQRRHVLSTTLIRLTNLYRAPKFQRKEGLRRSGCGAAGAADSTDARVRSISGRARRFVPAAASARRGQTTAGLQPDDRLIMSARLGGRQWGGVAALGWRA